jgi:translation initiation factor 1
MDFPLTPPSVYVYQILVVRIVINPECLGPVLSDTRLVYSTETGRICSKCRKPVSSCTCKKIRPDPQPQFKQDGIIRIQRETKGRKGKTMTTVFGFDLDDQDLKSLAKDLKQQCGTGGSVKDGMIVLQGDHRDAVKGFLEESGFGAKIAGG